MARISMVTGNEPSNSELQDTSEFPSVEYLLSLRGSDTEEDEDEDEDSSVSDSSLEERLRRTYPPAHGESFCNCHTSLLTTKLSKRISCKCGEEDTEFDWKWDADSKSAGTVLQCDDREVKFHCRYSCGTAAVRGNQPMTSYQYYWEVKMTTPVYGTDMMVGVGTSATNLDKFRYTFGSLLGDDSDSWGFSYYGYTYHKGITNKYSTHFGHGTIIGVHLDMWNGTLSFYKNRQPLGIAYSGLQGKTLFPMVSSTAARSGMKIVRCRSFTSSLQFLCCVKLREAIPNDLAVLDAIDIPPGLKAFLQNNLDWLLCARKARATNESGPSKRKRAAYQAEDSEGSDAEPPAQRQKTT